MSVPDWLEASDAMRRFIDDTPRLHVTPPGELQGGLEAVITMLSDAAVLAWVQAGCQVCPHLAAAAGKPQPTILFLYDTRTARCLRCAANRELLMKGTDEDFTCDLCGTTDRSIDYYPIGNVEGFVAVQGGICERCHDRAAK